MTEVQPPPRRPTLRDVARAASVSISTASNALNGTAPLTPTTVARVQAAASALGYEPNQAARNLKHRRSQAIGLIIPDITDAYFAQVAAGIEEVASEAEYVLVLGTTEWRRDLEERHARLLRAQRLDGIIYNAGLGLPPAWLLKASAESPVVFVDERAGGVGVPFVGADNRRGARVAAEQVLAMGHRHIGLLTGPTGVWTADQRLAGWREGIAAAGLDPDQLPTESGDYRSQSGYDGARSLLLPDRERSPLTALLVANDAMAFGCLRLCREAGLRVPEDVSVVGFDDVPAAAMVTPALTTVRQPAREMGREAARVLLDRIEGREVPQSVALPAELVVRESLRGLGRAHTKRTTAIRD